MHLALTNQLWIGNARDARDNRLLNSSGIRAVIDLALEEAPAQLGRDFIYNRFPLVDGNGNSPELIVTAIESTVSLLRHQIPVLVACGAGMSRAPSIAAAALAVYQKRSPEDALLELATNQPHDVATTLWDDVLEAFNQLVD